MVSAFICTDCWGSWSKDYSNDIWDDRTDLRKWRIENLHQVFEKVSICISHRHLLVRSKNLSAIHCMTHSPKCSFTGGDCTHCRDWFFQSRQSRGNSHFAAAFKSRVRMFALLFQLDRGCYASLDTSSWLFSCFFQIVENHEFLDKWNKCCGNILGMKPSRNCFSNLPKIA